MVAERNTYPQTEVTIAQCNPDDDESRETIRPHNNRPGDVARAVSSSALDT